MARLASRLAPPARRGSLRLGWPTFYLGRANRRRLSTRVVLARAIKSSVSAGVTFTIAGKFRSGLIRNDSPERIRFDPPRVTETRGKCGSGIGERSRVFSPVRWHRR